MYARCLCGMSLVFLCCFMGFVAEAILIQTTGDRNFITLDSFTIHISLLSAQSALIAVLLLCLRSNNMRVQRRRLLEDHIVSPLYMNRLPSGQR